jgi:hypothetical protein
MLMRNEPSPFSVQSQASGKNPEAMMRFNSMMEIMPSPLPWVSPGGCDGSRVDEVLPGIELFIHNVNQAAFRRQIAETLTPENPSHNLPSAGQPRA